jgi:NitT/TauT family transport system ATP-binding protein
MSQSGAMIDLSRVYLTYGSDARTVDAVRDLSFSIARGEFVSLVGPSGCGKSTILHLIAGFIAPHSGSVSVAGAAVNAPGPDRGVVFQRHNLFPWKTVRENIALGMQLRGIAGEVRRQTTDDWITRIGLQGFAERYPHELSEGMRQRVGLARAFVTDPTVLLMDEPFASLDALTAIRMRELLTKMWENDTKTVLFVTHDIDEAILLSDRIIVLTQRPARLRTEISIDLPRPRSYDRSLSGAAERYRKVLRSLLLADG